MNQALKQIIAEIRGAHLPKARDATVRATLVLEHDARGYWDPIIDAFPQSGLYEQQLSDADVGDFIRELGECVSASSVVDELKQSVISALSKSSREEAFLIFTKLLNEADNLQSLCESSDLLLWIADFLDEPAFRRDHAKALTCLIQRLKYLTLSDSDAEVARKRVIANAYE